MKNARHLLFLLGTACAVLPGTAAAQNAVNTSSCSKPLWTANLSGGATSILLTSVISVSLHSYLLDGSVRMIELTVDTTGNHSIRFYAYTGEQANTWKERLSNTRDLVDSKTGGATRLPGRKFPEGAYSHNVEFQLDSEAQVRQLYKSLMDSWTKTKNTYLDTTKK
ncbi:MAG: hypothetical protein MSQ05_04805 [Akkermansia sp.]|nr:hypothetical protein [Akkermansia sp.]